MNKREIKKKSIIVVTLLVTIFWSTYCIGKMHFTQENKVINKSNKPVVANTAKNGELSDDTKVTLFEKDTNEETTKTLAELKQQLDLNGKVTKDELSLALKNQGYFIDNKTGMDDQLVYDQKIKPNMYYIMDYNGYLAIYKSDDKCQLSIEDPSKDVYKNVIKYSEFSEADKQYFENYLAEYRSKEDAESYMTQFVS